MEPRPRTITVFAWMLIGGGILTIINRVMQLNNPALMNNPMVQQALAQSPLPPAIQYALMFFWLIFFIVIGVGILKGKNWARFLYVAMSGLRVFINLLISPVKAAVIPALVIFAIAVLILYRPAANRFFSANESG